MGSPKTKRIIVLHGPNLNLLGTRETHIYGNATLSDINDEIKKKGNKLNLSVDTFQSNHEGELVDKIQESRSNYDGLIINPAAYTHTSIAIRDALIMLDTPIIEVHLSNIYKRESFRHKSYIADIATGQIAGLGIYGYLMAVDAMHRLLMEK